MKVLAAILSGALGLAGFAAWIWPDISIKDKFLITLFCIMLVAIVQLIFLIIQKSKTIKGLSDKLIEMEKRASETTSKHSALAERYDHRRAELNLYKEAMSEIYQLLSLSLANTKEAKLQILFNAFMGIKNNLIRSVNNDTDNENESDQNRR